MIINAKIYLVICSGDGTLSVNNLKGNRVSYLSNTSNLIPVYYINPYSMFAFKNFHTMSYLQS